MWPEVLPFECIIAQTEPDHRGHCCLSAIRRQMGTVRFNAQYRCDPSGYAGRKLKIEWLKDNWYRTLPEGLEIVMGVDPAISKANNRDYCAIAVCGYSKAENKIYAIEFRRGHYDFPEQLALITDIWQAHRASRIIVEAVSYQSALAQALTGTGLPVIPCKTVKDKITRIMNISPYFENRTIKCKEDQDDFIEEYVKWDGEHSAHDDLLDALCLATQDILDRWFIERGKYMPMLALGQVYKSQIPESALFPNGPGNSYESNIRVSVNHPLPETTKALSYGKGELCWSCGRQKGTCVHYPKVG